MFGDLFDIFFGAGFAVASAAGFVRFLGEIRRAFQSREWPSAMGKVLVSELEYNDEVHDPCVRYEYIVEGVKYLGDRIMFMESRTNIEGPGKRLVARFPVGEPVDVYYEPGNPNNAVLIPGAASGRLFWMVLATSAFPFFFLFSVWLFVSAASGIWKSLFS